jgi:hypothetical protein
MKQWGVKFDLPEDLAEKAASFPECKLWRNHPHPTVERRNACPARSRGLGSNVIKPTGAEEESLLSTLNPADIVDVVREPRKPD